MRFLKQFPALRRLKSLDLHFSSIGQEALDWACGCPNLKELRISVPEGVRIDWSSLSRARRLQSLDVSGQGFREEDLDAVLNFTNLRRIDISTTDLGGAALPKLLSQPKLREVELGGDQLKAVPWNDLPATTGAQILRGFCLCRKESASLMKLAARYPGVSWSEV